MPANLYPSSFRHHLVRNGPVAWLTAGGELDFAARAAFTAVLGEATGQPFPAVVVLDLRQATFLDACGLRVVLNAHDRSREDRWTLLILRGPPAVQLVFDVSGFTDTLHISPGIALLVP